MTVRQIPAPPINPETQEWWEACTAGKFLIPKDNSNGKLFWVPAQELSADRLVRHRLG